MFHFLKKKIFKKIAIKGTINVLQGGGVSRVWSKLILLHFVYPSLTKNVDLKSIPRVSKVEGGLRSFG